MASSHSLTFFFLSAIAISAIGGANARPGLHFHPCNTLFISFTTISSSSSSQGDPNHPSAFLTIYREEFNRFDPKPFVHPSTDLFILDDSRHRPDLLSSIRVRSFHEIDNPKPVREIPRPVPLRSFGTSSFRERTKDILSVVLALLFGVGCGALTSATLYLIWSLVTSRYESQESDGEDGDDHVNDLGYVKIPASPAKEGYEGN